MAIEFGMPKDYKPSDEEAAAVRKIYDGYEALQKLGWKDPRAMLNWAEPKKMGSGEQRWKDELFYAVSLGSTGVCVAQHLPNDGINHAWACEAHDLWPICTVLIRPIPKEARP